MGWAAGVTSGQGAERREKDQPQPFGRHGKWLWGTSQPNGLQMGQGEPTAADPMLTTV